MPKKESLSKLVLIVKKLRRGAATFQEIADYLQTESALQKIDLSINQRAFRKDLEEIESQFGIEIVCDAVSKKYKIIREEASDSSRIVNTLEVFNALQISERLSQYIEFDKTASRGTSHLVKILKAIEERNTLSFTYNSYWVKGSSVYPRVEPLSVKEFRNRWYLVGMNADTRKIKVFALERIGELAVTKDQFEYPADFDVRVYFHNCFGIIRPEVEAVQQVRLSFDPHEADYLKSLPLHHSQEILIDSEDEFCIELNINITYDFVKELLGYGSRVKVLQPKSLAQSIFNNAKILLTYYE